MAVTSKSSHSLKMISSVKKEIKEWKYIVKALQNVCKRYATLLSFAEEVITQFVQSVKDQYYENLSEIEEESLKLGLSVSQIGDLYFYLSGKAFNSNDKISATKTIGSMVATIHEEYATASSKKHKEQLLSLDEFANYVTFAAVEKRFKSIKKFSEYAMSLQLVKKVKLITIHLT
jgi:hypothetical protein